MTKASPRGSSAAISPEAAPFGVAVSAGGQFAFASVGSALAVLKLAVGRPAAVVHWVTLPEVSQGVALTRNGQYLLLAAGAGAVVVSVSAAEQGSSHAVLGELSMPGARGSNAVSAIEVAVSADGRYPFVSLEYGYQGLAVSPDGHWLYGTSEGKGPGTDVGTLSVISVPTAESDPAASVVVRVTAGCEPVRVLTSADGSVVWVTARASDALLAFSADRLRTDPAHALLADVRVGEAPVGLAFARHGSLIVVADSNRFGATGQSASLAVVNVLEALTGRPALVGYLPAGQFPRDMAASLGGGTVLVANYDSGQIETVNGAALP